MSENKKRRGLFGRPQQSAGQRAEEPRQEQQHTPHPKKKGRAGFIIGITMCQKMRKSPAPSIFPDSMVS